jgi:hypothetical protein
MSSSSGYEPVSNQYTSYRPISSIDFRLSRWEGPSSISSRIGFGNVLVNGTVVLIIIGLAGLFPSTSLSHPVQSGRLQLDWTVGKGLKRSR